MELPIAYIDPIAGSILLQVILAALLGTVAFFRQSITKLFACVFRCGRKKWD